MYTVKPRYNATRYNANSMITPIFRKHGFFPSLSLLKEPRYSAKIGLRELTITPVFADHQLVFSSKINPAIAPIWFREEIWKNNILNLDKIYGIIDEIKINKAVVVRVLMKVNQTSSTNTYGSMFMQDIIVIFFNMRVWKSWTPL